MAKVDPAVTKLVQEGDLNKLAEKLEVLELDCAAALPQAVAFPYYQILTAAYLALGDLNNARFLWKRAPSEAKKGTELAAVWEVGKALWKKEHAAFFRAVNSASWSAEVGLLIQRLTEETRSRMLEHVPRTYTSIRVSEFADLIGESADAAVALASKLGWTVDGKMIVPAAATESNVRKTGLKQLQQLTEYVVSLEA